LLSGPVREVSGNGVLRSANTVLVRIPNFAFSASSARSEVNVLDAITSETVESCSSSTIRGEVTEGPTLEIPDLSVSVVALSVSFEDGFVLSISWVQLVLEGTSVGTSAVLTRV
jgi:hypothetical protein